MWERREYSKISGRKSAHSCLGAGRSYLLDEDSSIYEYDLTNILKGFFSEYMYVDATEEESPDVRTAIPYLNSLDAYRPIHTWGM